MNASKQIKDTKLSTLQCKLDLCEGCCNLVIGKVATYRQLSAEHEWALEMIKMFEKSHKECESMHGLQDFNGLDRRVQNISKNLEDFKLKLVAAVLVVKDFLDERHKHIALLKELRDMVANETDMVQLEKIEVPSKHGFYHIPEFELDKMTEQWGRMNLLTHLMEFLLEQRILIDGVNGINKKDNGRRKPRKWKEFN